MKVQAWKMPQALEEDCMGAITSSGRVMFTIATYVTLNKVVKEVHEVKN